MALQTHYHDTDLILNYSEPFITFQCVHLKFVILDNTLIIKLEPDQNPYCSTDKFTSDKYLFRSSIIYIYKKIHTRIDKNILYNQFKSHKNVSSLVRYLYKIA